MILTLGDGDSHGPDARRQVHGIPWRSIPKLWIPGHSAYRSPGTSSHTYPGEMKMNDEKKFQTKTFFKRGFWFVVFNSSWKCGNVIDSCSMLCYLSRTVQHVVMWDMVYWCCSVAIVQWWHKDGKAEKPCLSIKLHLAAGKHHASLTIKGRLRVFHALVWMS